MGALQRLAFMTQWLDPASSITWTYQLMVFPQSEEVELFDVKNRRTFLKRTRLEGMKPELFFVGSKVTIFGRQLDIVDYGDAFTQRALAGAKQRHAVYNMPETSARERVKSFMVAVVEVVHTATVLLEMPTNNLPSASGC
jgi:nucleoside-diphosphate kinase